MHAFAQKALTQPLFAWRVASTSVLLSSSLGIAVTSACSADVGAPSEQPGPMASNETLNANLPGSTNAGESTTANTIDATGASGAPSSTSTNSKPETPDPAIPLMTGVRPGFVSRLTKSEYQHSVYDALGVTLTEKDLSASEGALPDDAGDGVFKRFGDKQATIEQHAFGLLHTAQLVAERTDIGSLIKAGGGCTEARLECVTIGIAHIGKRLFRRHLDSRELTVFGSVGADALDRGLDLEPALRWVLTALLQAPQFVFHLTNETTGSPNEKRALSPTELGARLASFIWNSVPDDPLIAAAEDGTLANRAVLDAQIKRMLADPKAKRMTENFIRDFSRAEKASFVDATDADREALRESVVATFQAHVWEAKRSLAELFTTTDFVVNARTAELLGLPAVSEPLTHADVSALPERVGILTHPGSLAGMGDQLIGSLVNRGKYLMERLLCQHPIAVPDALAAALEEFKMDTTGLNELERVAIRKTRPQCWACHAQFEPFAFGFVRFDGAGRYLGTEDEQGKPLPLDGWVPVTSEALAPHYTNVAEYMQILATEPRVQQCMTEHFLSYATSFSPDSFTRGAAPAVGEEYKTGGQTLEAMVTAVVHSDLFQYQLAQAPAPSKENN